MTITTCKFCGTTMEIPIEHLTKTKKLLLYHEEARCKWGYHDTLTPLQFMDYVIHLGELLKDLANAGLPFGVAVAESITLKEWIEAQRLKELEK